MQAGSTPCREASEFRPLWWSLALGGLAACSGPPSSTEQAAERRGRRRRRHGVRRRAVDRRRRHASSRTRRSSSGPTTASALVGATAAVDRAGRRGDRRPHRHDRDAGDRGHAHAPVSATARGLDARSAAPRVLRRQRGDEPGTGQRRRRFCDARARSIPGAALYRTAGRGITAPEPGRTDIPVLDHDGRGGRARRCASTPRSAVDIVKIWVDDRNGQYKKLAPELYGAVIDEAHAERSSRRPRTCSRSTMRKSCVRAGSTRSRTACATPISTTSSSRWSRSGRASCVVPNLPDRGVATDMSWLSGELAGRECSSCRPRATDRPEAQAALRRSRRATCED